MFVTPGVTKILAETEGVKDQKNEHTISHPRRRHDRLRKDALPIENVGGKFQRAL